MDNSTREDVKDFYSEAAATPQEDLCCPTSYPKQNIDHIPQVITYHYLSDEVIIVQDL